MRLIAIALMCAFSAVIGYALAQHIQVRTLESHIAFLHAVLAVPEPAAFLDLTSEQTDN